jgi:hypothetical protein
MKVAEGALGWGEDGSSSIASMYEVLSYSLLVHCLCVLCNLTGLAQMLAVAKGSWSLELAQIEDTVRSPPT